MLKFIEQKLSAFRSCFSRTATFNWFLLIITGLMTRTDSLGVTSFIRALSLDQRFYESMLHFFRSHAFKTPALKNTWHKIVLHNAPFIRLNNRIMLLGDGTKVSKESRHMPAVKKLCQESEDSSKPQFIHGHMYGGVGAVAGNDENSFCIPLDLNIQDGLKETSSWEGGDISDSASHVIQMVRNSHEITQTFGQDCYCVLDRYFLTVPALAELRTLNADSKHRLDIITRAKNNCVAYEKPTPSSLPHRGRPRKKGATVKLGDLFSKRADDFTKADVMMYGKKQEVSYLSLKLLWGSKLYQEVQFVLVKYNNCTAIFVCTDLMLDPVLVIEAYAHRFKIEFFEENQTFYLTVIWIIGYYNTLNHMNKKGCITMEEKKNLLTYAGLKKLEDELHDLKVVRRKEVSMKIKEAREQGDLSENAEYDAAKDEQRDIEARIEQIEKILKNAEVVVEDEVDSEKINVGCKVLVYDMEFEEEMELKIVGSTEASSLQGKISNESPVGKALIGAKVNDIVDVELPNGTIQYKVLKIERNI